MIGKVGTFGEIMLRLSPEDHQRFCQTQGFRAIFGGGEANVAVSLALFGHDVWFATRVPGHAIGEAATRAVAQYGVHTDFILRGGDRLGIYFLEHGASVRPSQVVYDRAGSSIATAQPGDFDWDTIFHEKNWFHITGITPALSDSCRRIALEAVDAARKAGLTISCDLNYRKKLWSREEAGKVMTPLTRNIDLIIANEEDAADVFGIEVERTDVTSGSLSLDHYVSVASQLRDLTGCGKVAITLRESHSASDNGWSALLWDGKDHLTTRQYPLHLVDRVGGGDSFGAGLIHGFLSGWEPQQCLDFAVAASALKQTIPGDFNLVTEAEVLKLAGGDLSGRVQR